jgi:hypothetical protein
MRVTATDLARLGGLLDIVPQDASLPALGSLGRNYLGGSGFYFGIYGLVPGPQTAELYRFEEYDYTGDRRPETPLVAVRRPATGTAQVVTLGFQLEYADGLGTAIEALGRLLEDHLGHPVQPVGAKR